MTSSSRRLESFFSGPAAEGSATASTAVAQDVEVIPKTGGSAAASTAGLGGDEAVPKKTEFAKRRVWIQIVTDAGEQKLSKFFKDAFGAGAAVAGVQFDVTGACCLQHQADICTGAAVSVFCRLSGAPRRSVKRMLITLLPPFGRIQH